MFSKTLLKIISLVWRVNKHVKLHVNGDHSGKGILKFSPFFLSTTCGACLTSIWALTVILQSSLSLSSLAGLNATLGLLRVPQRVCVPGLGIPGRGTGRTHNRLSTKANRTCPATGQREGAHSAGICHPPAGLSGLAYEIPSVSPRLAGKVPLP